MPLQPGTALGPYQIDAPLGAGGMGEVYKASDTRLDRTVAIKVLPEHVAADPDLKQRFEREARTVAALNHPHICTLFDIGREGETDFLVMEYLDGETVAQRLEKGALPLDHGFPVRLIAPGWYGCANAKWVDAITFVDDDTVATRQMREFAGRTHQQDTPSLARDFAPATMDLAAMPVRVEKQRIGGRLGYRIVGIAWGGDRRIDRLQIRLGMGAPATPIRDLTRETYKP